MAEPSGLNLTQDTACDDRSRVLRPKRTSQSCTPLNPDAKANCCPSGLKSTSTLVKPWKGGSGRVGTTLPLVRSHKPQIPSGETAARCFPSREHATAPTTLMASPATGATSRWASTSQIRTFCSSLVEARRLPSGLNARLRRRLCRWRWHVVNTVPVSMSQSVTTPPTTLTRYFPSGLKIGGASPDWRKLHFFCHVPTSQTIVSDHP